MGNINCLNLCKYILAGCFVSVMAGCNGGGSSAVAGAPTNKTTLSSDQAAYESFNLTPNSSYVIGHLLPSSGAPVYDASFFVSHYSSLSASPLTNGTQKTVLSNLASISNTLPIPAIASNPARYLINGQIIAGSAPNSVSYVSYQGTSIKHVLYAADGVTPVSSSIISNVTIVPLAGNVAVAPAEFSNWLNSLYSNTALLNANTTWQSGAAYMKYTVNQLGDRYAVNDFTGRTSGSSPNPVATGTTIFILMVKGGINVSSDQTNYTMSNGTVSLINGVHTYVANNPLTNHLSTEYRTFYELNGNVFMGSLMKDGMVYRSGTINDTEDFQFLVNKAVVASLQTAFTNEVIAPAGTILTMIANETVLVPAGTTITTPNNNQITVNGTSNTVNATVGTVVNVPTSATGPANNAVITGAT